MSVHDRAEESKFAHLLQPIRDLAANWDINIANELEDYLDVLESVTFSFEGGPNLNFAEAALLIQGSACVYGKKVEYLHTLVYQALEFIAEKRRKDSKASTQPHDIETDDVDDEEQFLNLDDVLEEGTGIDLDQNSTTALPAAVRPPSALLALESSYSATGGDNDARNYRAQDGEFLDDQLCSSSASASTQMQYEGQPTANQEAQQAVNIEQGNGVGQHDVHNDIDGGGDDFGGSDDYMHQDPPSDLQEQAHASGFGQTADAHQQAAGPQAVPEEEEEEEYDPYAPLDPHTKGSLPIKPFKKGRKPSRRKRQRQAAQQNSLEGWSGFTVPPAAVKGCSYVEFNSVLDALNSAQRAKHAAAAKDHRKGGHRAPHSDAQLRSAFTREDAAAGCADIDDQDEVDAGFANGAWSDRGSEPECPANDLADLDDWAELAGAGNAAGSMCQPPADGDADMTYEQLCQAHIEAFIQAAAAAEVQTELAARVSSWRQKIQPMLQEQDARPAFDIHQYGDNILDRLAVLSCKDPSHPVELEAHTAEALDFEAVAEQASQAEVSRMFSAMLQLINNGNIHILPGRATDDPFQIKLHSLHKPHQQFSEFRAPSAHPGQGCQDESLQLPLQELSRNSSKVGKPVKAVKRRKAAVV